ncbi:MAG: DUF6588 family protein [Bdellovibrionota bacterium]
MFTKPLSSRWIAVFLGALLPCLAFADTPTLSNLLPGDYDAIVKDFSANFTYSSVTPASSLGGLGGFEFGLVGGVSKDPNLKALVTAASPSTNLPNYLAHAALLGRVGLPYGLTAELMLFPSRTISGISLQEVGGSVMWTPTDDILDELPLNLAAKLSYQHAKLSFTQNATVASGTGAGTVVPVNLGYTDTEWALQAIASKKLLVFEPFVGMGYVKSHGVLDLGTNGFTVNIFNVGSFPQAALSNTADSSPNSFQVLAGVDIRLAFFSLGAEYQRSFGTDTYTGRLSFRF